MKKAIRFLLLMVVFCLVFWSIRLIRPYFLLWSVERQLNQIYLHHRPFPYRWAGAPYGVLTSDKEPWPELNTALIDLRAAESRTGRTARTRQLLGRIYLLRGSYDLAAKEYASASLLDPENKALHLEMGIAFALRATAEQRPLDNERALEEILGAERQHPTHEGQFDAALLFDEVPLPLQARDRWREVVTNEQSSVWLGEAQERLTALKLRLEKRRQQILELTDSPSSYLTHRQQAYEDIELVVEKALASWISEAPMSPVTREALTALAEDLRETKHDAWLSNMLSVGPSPTGQAALQALSHAWNANSSGDPIQAERFSALARQLFDQLGNTAGILRSQLELVYALQRQSLGDNCLRALSDVQQAAHRHGYIWIEGQSVLEKISCLTLMRKSDVISPREDSYEWISHTGYEALRLRALEFLTENCVCFGSRLRIWKRGQEGLRSYWSQPLPLLRGYSFYFNLASSAHNAEDREAAIALLAEATQSLEGSNNQPLLAYLFTLLGKWQMEAGWGREADLSFEKAASLRGKSDSTDPEIFRQTEILRAEAETVGGNNTAALDRLNRLTSGIAFPYTAFPGLDRKRLLPVYGNALRISGQYDRAEQYYESIIQETRSDLVFVHGCAQRDSAQREIESAWRGLTELDIHKGARAQSLGDWESFRGARLGDPTRAPVNIPPGVILLAYAFLPSGLSAWLADKDGVEHYWIDSLSASRGAVQFIGLVADPDSPPEAVRDSARRLNRLLIEPFASRLSEGNVLVIDADGVLSGIPWAAIEDDAGRALIERFPISQALGWTEVARGLAQGAVDFNKLLVFGEPALGVELMREYPPLIHARRQAESLRRQIPSAAFFAGPDATLEKLSEYAPRSTLFYFAGHGVSYGGFGALLLAPSQGTKAAARLVTAEEIALVDLHHLQMAVLAACSAGAGEESGNVNLDSLVRAFLDAGTSRVVAARWNVNSLETAELMSDFHQATMNGLRPAQALRQAILKIRSRSSNRPYDWAAFQVFGSP